jgi:HD superfamily phosphohydrolase
MARAGSTVLRDAIWGDIELGPRELALIDTPAFQRLRRVKQLGTTDLVFPGARHTRFEHSIGVFHLSGLVLERLRTVGAPNPTDADVRSFRAAALAHDVGHYPFSHAIEELEMDQVRGHTEIARDLLTTGELADVLRKDWDTDPALVAAFVAGPEDGAAEPTEAQVLLRSLLDSSLDVDKLDYLVRDARAANVPYGIVDVQRLVASLTVWDDADGRPVLAVESKGVSALQSLVFAKHLMFATVYWHHACRSAVVMLLRAVQDSLRAGALRPAEIETSDDATLLAGLVTGGSSLGAALARRLVDRRLYKRAIEVPAGEETFERLERMWFNPTQRSVLEDGWAASIDEPAGSVLLDVPEPRRIAVDMPVVVGDGEAREWDRVSGLSSADLERFQRWVRTIRVFASTRDTAARLRATAEEFERALTGFS